MRSSYFIFNDQDAHIFVQIKIIKLLNIWDAHICMQKIQQPMHIIFYKPRNKLRNSVTYWDAYFLHANVINVNTKNVSNKY